MREVTQCYDANNVHGLYHLSKEDIKKFGEIPRIDHKYMEKVGDKFIFSQHPYKMDMKKLKELISWAEKNGWNFHIYGHSCYYPGATFCIRFYKNKK